MLDSIPLWNLEIFTLPICHLINLIREGKFEASSTETEELLHETSLWTQNINTLYQRVKLKAWERTMLPSNQTMTCFARQNTLG